MKTLSLILGIAALAGCDMAPKTNYEGKYIWNGGIVVETLDLANNGAAMHSIELPGEKNAEIVTIFKSVQLHQAKWSEEGGKIKVQGLRKQEKGDEEAWWIVEPQPSGDLIRHNEDGQFVRFVKS
jgi:type III secretory pathway lipoprotein EscJ